MLLVGLKKIASQATKDSLSRNLAWHGVNTKPVKRNQFACIMSVELVQKGVIQV